MLRKTVSGMLLYLFMVSILTFALNTRPVKSSGTIYIRADGSIDPPTAPISSLDKITYTLTEDITDSIVIERNNIVVDGAGHTIEGTGSGNGIDLTGRSSVTVKNMEIRTFGWGIASNLGGSSSNNRIIENNIVNNGDGIVLYSCTEYIISGNNMTSSTFQDGIWMFNCFNNRIVRNDIRANKRGGVVIASFSENNIVIENNISDNIYAGIMFDWESNRFFHNNLVDNTVQAVSPWGVAYTNVWDDDYSSGGNYWSDYSGVDVYSGPDQNVLGNDGIGDTPYVIDVNNIDHYPLMNPWKPISTATIDIDPDVLSLRSNSKWITSFIELPEGYDVSEIDVSTIRMNSSISVDSEAPFRINDYDGDGIEELMAKFDKQAVMNLILANCSPIDRFGRAVLTITGKLADQTQFAGSDTIKIILFS